MYRELAIILLVGFIGLLGVWGWLVAAKANGGPVGMANKGEGTK